MAPRGLTKFLSDAENGQFIAIWRPPKSGGGARFAAAPMESGLLTAFLKF